MATKKVKTEETAPISGAAELAQALKEAIQSTKTEKKNPFNRTVLTPWTPKDGSKKLKLKRKVHQHGIPMDEDKLSNTEIALLNKIRPGSYLDGYVKVVRRRDRGLDIDYLYKTASQKLRLVNQFGVRNLTELLERIVEEAENPVKPQFDADGDAL